jgi:hypothetical protein
LSELETGENLAGVLRIRTRLVSIVVVPPFEAANLGFPTGRMQRELKDALHWYFGSPVAAAEVLAQPLQLVRGGAASAPARFPDQSQLRAGIPSFPVEIVANVSMY